MFACCSAAEQRGTLNCNLFNTFLGNVPGAAHCLRFDPLYYQAGCSPARPACFALAPLTDGQPAAASAKTGLAS